MSKKEKKSTKSVSKTTSKPTKKSTGLTTDDYDEVDHFHTKKDQILLEENDDDVIDSDEADYNPNTILDLPDEEDDDEEYFKNDVESDGEDEDHDWGRGRKNYYSADKGKDAEEKAEAERLYKKKLSGMTAKDFGVEESEPKSGDSKPVIKSVVFSSDSDSEPATELADQQSAPQVEKVEQNLQIALTEVKQVLQPLMEKVNSGSIPRSEGLSFLQTKYNLLLQYCINAVYYVKAKAEGKTISDDDPVMERLIKYRMLIEKMKPLEAKLKNQIDRLLKAAIEPETAIATDEVLRARPELMNSDDEDQKESDTDTKESSTYRPPKTMQTEMFDEQKSRKSNKTRHSRIQEELLREELMDEDAPEEDDTDVVKRVGGTKHITGTKDSLEDLEEDNFVRFQLSKKDKHKLAEQSRILDGLDDLNDMFDEFDRRRGGKKHDSEDEADVVIKSKSKKRSKGVADEDDEIDSDIASGNDNNDDDDGDYYEKVKSAKKAKKANKEEERQAARHQKVHFHDQVDLSPSQPRRATKSILSNRGLTPSRPRDTKNPRVKQRKRFEKASKRIGSYKPVHRTNTGPYAGETTGIRTNITRSAKF